MGDEEAPPKQTRATRRTRIVCISDTHNSTAIKIPKGDVLIHAGDLTNQGSYSEVCPTRSSSGPKRLTHDSTVKLSKTVQWLEKLDFEAKIVIAGQ